MLRKAKFGLATLGLSLFSAPGAFAATAVALPHARPDAGTLGETHEFADVPSDDARSALPLDDAALDHLRGGQAIVIANQSLTSVVAGDIGGDVSGGAVTLSDNALSGFNGLGNIVINTGSQLSLQSGMNITINISQ